MVDAACSRGAANVTVGEVVERAGVSRRTFYELFAGAEDCLQAALEQTAERAISVVREAYEPESPWRLRIRAGLEALLSLLDEEPATGRLLIVESFSRPDAHARRSKLLARVAAEIDSGRSAPRSEGLSPLTAEGLVGSVHMILHSRIVAQRRTALLELTSPLMAMIVLPYLGPAAARRELSQPAPEPRRVRRPAPAAHEQLSGLPMRLTYRTMMVLGAIASDPGASNRRIGAHAGISDQGQISKLLQRLARLGLIEKARDDGRGAANAWTLTSRGADVQRVVGMTRKGG